MKCTALLACEKLIIDKDGAHSLINVMQNAKVKIQEQTPDGRVLSPPIPANAVMPTQWFIFAVWFPGEDDVNAAFEQVYQIYWPNGDKLIENRVSFIQRDMKQQSTSFSIVGLPVGQVGMIRIATWLDKNGHRISEVMETFFGIEHLPADNPAVAVR